MARITNRGTFVYCKGNIILDGWQVDCEGGEVLTQPEVVSLVIDYIRGALVLAPELRAAIDAQAALSKLRDAGGL